MNQINPNRSIPITENRRVEKQTNNPATSNAPIQKPTEKQRAKPQNDSISFKDVIHEATQRSQEDSSTIDAEEASQASQTGRLNRNRDGKQGQTSVVDTFDAKVGVEYGRKARAKPVALDQPPLGRIKQREERDNTEYKVATTPVAHTEQSSQGDKAKGETAAQKFARVTTSMNSVSDVGSFAHAPAAKRIANILAEPISTRIPDATRELNEEQLIVSIQRLC